MMAHEVLRAAHTLITEGGWSPRDVALDATGRPVDLYSGPGGKINPLAVRFSIYGAVCKASAGQRQSDASWMWAVMGERAEAALGHPAGRTNYVHPVVGFNNAEGRTVDDVLAYLAGCADECEARAKVAS